MADKVELNLERTLPELAYYEEHEIFSKSEINDIIKTRKTHEYTIVAPSAKRADYIRAILYEQELERQMVKNKSEDTHSALDFSIRRRIFHLYDRLVQRYPSIHLYKDYIHYLLKCNSMLKYGQVIQHCLHCYPHCLDFWMIAGFTELDIRGSVEGSRAIFLQAI